MLEWAKPSLTGVFETHLNQEKFCIHKGHDLEMKESWQDWVVTRIGKDCGHLTTACNHPGQKRWGQKAWKGEEWIFFFFSIETYQPHEEECYVKNQGYTFLWEPKKMGPWKAGQVPDWERAAFLQPPYILWRGRKKRKELVKTHTTFRLNFSPVSFWKPLEQPQCFKTEAENLPISQKCSCI